MNKLDTATSVTVALPAFLQSEAFLFNELLPKPTVAPTQKFSSKLFGEAILVDLLTEEQKPPAFAALSALGNDLDASEGWWLHLDPIELLVDAGNICLVGRDHLDLTESESRQLIATLNKLLVKDDLELLYGSPFEWYIKLNSKPEICTAPLLQVVAKDIRAYLPSGAKKNNWNKLLTELQMLLFDHAINATRQQQGKPIINSVWPWGEGALNSPFQIRNYSAIWSNNSFATGMVKQSNQTVPIFPMTTFKNNLVESTGNYLIVVNHFGNEAHTIDVLFNLLLDYYEGRIQKLAIHTGSGDQYYWQSRKKSFLAKLFKRRS